MAGLMFHAREISAVLSQWVNSYKRLIEGYEAPVYIAWGQKNRSAYIRVPEYQPGKEMATRIELRSPDPACNIYLAFAAMLTAGLAGIRGGYPPARSRGGEHLRDVQRQAEKIRDPDAAPEPRGSPEDSWKKAGCSGRTLSEHLFHTFIANKRAEIEEYNINVSGEFEKQVSEYRGQEIPAVPLDRSLKRKGR